MKQAVTDRSGCEEPRPRAWLTSPATRRLGGRAGRGNAKGRKDLKVRYI